MTLARKLGRWDPERRSTAYIWGVAAAATVVTVLARVVLNVVAPQSFPFLTLLPGVLVTAFFAGPWPAVAVTAVSGLAVARWFLPPGTGADVKMLGLAFFAVIAAIDIVLIALMQKAIRTITRERAEAAKQSEVRRLMFQELQHRTSNHLTMLSGLMKLQRRQITDPVARKALDDSVARLLVVARLQRLLHDPAAQTVNLARFLEDMAHELAHSAGIEGRIAVTVQAATVVVDADTAVPFGLIATELVSNAVEHGFPGNRAGTIAVRFSAPDDRRAVLDVTDSGVGPRPGFDLGTATSLGLKLAVQFAGQLGGSLTITPGPDGGTQSRLEFPVPPAARNAPGGTAETYLSGVAARA